MNKIGKIVRMLSNHIMNGILDIESMIENSEKRKMESIMDALVEILKMDAQCHLDIR